MKIKVNENIIKIIISVILFVLALIFQDYRTIYFILLVCSYLIVSYKIFIDAVKKIVKGNVFDENTLMIIATISAFIIGEYPEAVMVMLLFEFGEYLSDLAIDNSKESIIKLMDLRSDYVNLKKGEKIEKVDIKEVHIDDVFVVKPGEKVPLDGIVLDGKTFADTASLTGESVPREIDKSDIVLSGFVNGSGLITVKATSVAENSVASKIINLLQNSNDKKTKTEKFITKFSKIYTPIVVILAALIVLIPTMLGADFNNFLYKALVFLVTACPCALVISVPLGFFCGVGRASKEGILIKGSDGLEGLSKLDAVVFDKTGTITEGKFEVRDIVSNDISKEELLELAACAEYYSNHPIARSIVKTYKGHIDESLIKDYKEISGYGAEVLVNDKRVIIGNDKLLNQENVIVEKVNDFGTTVYVACDSKYVGYLVIGDKIKESAYNSVNNLKKMGMRVVMLSGDTKEMVKMVADKVKIDEYYSELLPIDKVQKLKEIKKLSYTAFAGDGVNDAPVIKEADLGISMGGIGSDAAIEASDVVLMHDNLNKIVTAIKISHVTQKIVMFNIIFALSFKFLMLILATLGFASIWMAVFADVGVTLLAVLNALRIMKKKL